MSDGIRREIVIVDKTESLTVSVFTDIITFGVMSLCVYISRESTLWTTIAVIMFLFFIVGLVVSDNARTKKFKSKAEVQAWLDGWED